MTMADDDYGYEDDDEGQEQEEQRQAKMAQLSVKDLRALRKAAKEREELTRKAAQMERELAFARANLDLNDPRMGYFIKGYEGEMTPDAIREAAQAAGFIAASPDQQVTAAEQQAHERMSDATAGAKGTGSMDPLDELRQFKTGDREGIMAYLSKKGVPTSWNRPE